MGSSKKAFYEMGTGRHFEVIGSSRLLPSRKKDGAVSL